MSDDRLGDRDSFMLAMHIAAWYWPGISISDGAFDILRQVVEMRERHGHPGRDCNSRCLEEKNEKNQ
jgi:hypothetical protein